MLVKRTRRVPSASEWKVCIKNHHEAYISWEQYENNLALWQVVHQNLRTFQEMTEETGGSLPQYVWQEFERFIACGDFSRGLAKVRCRTCGYDRLVPFACLGRRSLCPSCCGRVMNETAAYWVDHVIGKIPVRHWTNTLPPGLHYLLSPPSRGEVMSVAWQGCSKTVPPVQSASMPQQFDPQSPPVA
jgi:hypothetical protein